MFPDVILNYQSHDIYGHKAIIALASPKLAKIFREEQARTTQENCPVYCLDEEVPGLQFADFSRIIQSCYSGFDAVNNVIDLTPNRLVEIAQAAERLEMHHLSRNSQTKCVTNLRPIQNVEKLLDALEVAHKSGLVVLKQGCMAALNASPVGMRCTPTDLARLDKDLLVGFLAYITSTFSTTQSASFGFSSSS